MINKIFLFLLIVFKQIFTAIFKMIQIKEDYALKKSKVLIFEKFSGLPDDKKGSIESGKFADLAILDGTITKLPPREIYDMKVLRTYCDGKLVYNKD